MSRIHALQSSTTSHKLLEAVCSLRPLLCEALRATGFDTAEIDEHDPILLHVDQSLPNEDVRGLVTSHTSGPAQHCVGIYAQFVHVQEELANCHTVSLSDGHIHDLHVNAEYGHHCLTHEKYLHMQHFDSQHVARQSHNYANSGHVRHDVSGQCQDADCQGYAKHFSTEFGDAPLHHNEAHQCDMWMYHQHGHHCDAHHYEHGHDSTLNAYLRFQHSFPMTVESSISMNPLCTQYSVEGANHHIHAYHNYSLGQHFPSKTMVFLNTMPLGAPGSITDDFLIGAEATSKSSNNMYECMRVQDNLSRGCMRNINIHKVDTGHQVSGEEISPLPAELCNLKDKLPKTKLKLFESSDKTEATDTKEEVKQLSLKGEATTSTMSFLSERRGRKKWNEGLYAPRTVCSEMDKCEGTDTKEDIKLLSLKSEATKSTMSFFSERRRRKSWNEVLYAPRTVCSEMDKLLIAADMLTYLQQPRDNVDKLKNNISSL